ncbi:hypothetical protein E2C01_028709 [Portunus trituberculatus]|uniref:Uncharacterized protein n=1 Tax=Portunus trituberculatus TaxID=210409 RepID=A0A5B7EQ78_PORTR|nr:hypothetical protein [Portunus trituberculatus]
MKYSKNLAHSKIITLVLGNSGSVVKCRGGPEALENVAVERSVIRKSKQITDEKGNDRESHFKATLMTNSSIQEETQGTTFTAILIVASCEPTGLFGDSQLVWSVSREFS